MKFRAARRSKSGEPGSISPLAMLASSAFVTKIQSPHSFVSRTSPSRTAPGRSAGWGISRKRKGARSVGRAPPAFGWG